MTIVALNSAMPNLNLRNRSQVEDLESSLEAFEMQMEVRSRGFLKTVIKPFVQNF